MTGRGRWSFCPSGSSSPGPRRLALSTSAVLWLGVIWSVAAAAAVLAVPSVRAMGRVDYSLSSGA